jgi:DNA-binding beta-propeller fold protein YncE
VYVTGESQASTDDFGDYATVAYDAATGSQAWVSRFDGSVHDIPCCIQVSPTGTRVFVTGFTVESPSDYDWATVAYAAGDGAQEWVATHAGTGGSFDYAEAIAISPAGDRVFVTGSSRHGTLPTDADFTTIAYQATGGAESWLTTYDGRSGQEDRACCIGISPDGEHVYVAGFSDRAMSRDRFLAMIAYATGTGQQEWFTTHNDPSSTSEQPYALAVGPDGTRVFVSGTISFPATVDDLLTLALRA